MTCRELYQQRRNRDGGLTRDEGQRKPADCLCGVRHEGGVSPDQALMWNVGTCRSDAKREPKRKASVRVQVSMRSTGTELLVAQRSAEHEPQAAVQSS
jgi:hypothetical protein